MRRLNTPAMVVAIIALVFSLTGGAYAAKSLIDGRDIKNGSVSAAKLSRAAKRSLEGDKGAKGEQGSAGAVGAQGPAGPAGPAGAKGEQGAAGAKGEKGDAGAQGPQGAAGARGAQGAQGPRGDAGAQGATGAQGPEGDQGIQGPAGADAEYRVSDLSSDLDVAAPGWAQRELVSVDADGLAFGPFADGDAHGAARTNALDGLRLKDVELIAFSSRFTGGVGGGGTPYLKIVTEGDNHVMFSPLANAAMGGVMPAEGVWQRWVATNGGVTYDNDGGNPTETWDELVAGPHGDEKIAYAEIQAGWAGDGSVGSTSHVANVTMEATGMAGIFPGYTFGL